MSRWKFAQRPLLHASLLVLLCGILYFPYLGSIPLFDKGEPREALAVQDIIQRGEWLVPLKRATDVPSKPPLFHWSGNALDGLLYGSDDSLSFGALRNPRCAARFLAGLVSLQFEGRVLGRRDSCDNDGLPGPGIERTGRHDPVFFHNSRSCPFLCALQRPGTIFFTRW